MKKILTAIVALLAIMFSCTGNKSGGAVDVPADSDSIVDTAKVDTMEMLIAETPMPKSADELFDDFFFNFAASRQLQLKRTRWPLALVNFGKSDTISRRKWKTEHFFMHQGYYTLILDNERQLTAIKDTTIDHVTVEKIYLSKNYVKKFIFNRERGMWMLDSIVNKSLAQSHNASFLKFYQRFAVDSVYQQSSISEVVKFVGPDPDDDFAMMEGVLTPETWPAFAPELPKSMIYNIVYGHPGVEGNRKILVFRGISNGFEMEITFQRTGKRWMLTKLSE